jgi:uncharacterized protein YkwD
MKPPLRNFILLTIFLSCLSASPEKQAARGFKSEFLSRINKIRSEGCYCGTVYMKPAPPLVWNNDLETAAQNHAEDMSSKNYFSHTSKDGRTMADRAIAAGYTYKNFKNFTVGENIAEGQMSIAEVMDGWLKSPGHCRNLMNPEFKEVGVAQFNLYWVQDFGGRTPFSAEEQRLIKSGRVKIIQKAPTGD